jgi:branched-chain amino acid transport system ATP-binding protein
MSVAKEWGMYSGLLTVRSVAMRFGGLVALADVDLEVMPGQIHGLIGPNGSGKTTLFNVITGFHRPTSGRVYFKGHDITGLRPDLVARQGIARTFQNVKLFGDMSVEENLLVGQHVRGRGEFLASVLRPGWLADEARQRRSRADQLLESLGLALRKDEVARNLSYGQQRLVELGRALAMNPELLLLDEPTAGLNDTETMAFIELIHTLRGRSYAILLVEHDMRVVMGVCDRITVLDHGRKIAVGTAQEVQETPAVVSAYLGSGGQRRRQRDRSGHRA